MPVSALAYTASPSMRAQMGYSVLSQLNKPESTAMQRVSV